MWRLRKFSGMRSLKRADELVSISESADTHALREAYDIVKQGEWSREELEVYDYWSIRAQDERGAIQYALNAGRQQGIQQCRHTT